jgi:hypothetical protein
VTQGDLGGAPVSVVVRARNPWYDGFLSQIQPQRFRAMMSVSYEAVLEVSEDTALFLSGLLRAERLRRGTRANTRSLSTYKQAVLVLRRFWTTPG